MFAINVRQLFRRNNIFSVLSNEQDTEMSIKKLTLIKNKRKKIMNFLFGKMTLRSRSQ